MNKFQIATLASYKLMVTESDNAPTITSLIPNYVKAIRHLRGINVEIDGLSQQQAVDITGITKEKNSLLEELADCVIDVAGAVHSYAVGKNDQILQAKVNYKARRLNSMKQAELIDAAGIVLEEAGKIPAATLAEEGITAEEMTRFAELHTLFKDVSDDKREAVIDRSADTDRIAELFAEAAALKKNTLDRLATQFQRKAPEFYQRYKDASTVIYSHSPKKQTEEVQA